VNRGSSVSTVSGYGLDDRANEVPSPADAKNFSSRLCVQTGSGAHPASCTMGTGGPFPGAKRGLGVTLTTPPHLMPRSKMSRSYTSSLPSFSVEWSGTALALFIYFRNSHNHTRLEQTRKSVLLIETVTVPLTFTRVGKTTTARFYYFQAYRYCYYLRDVKAQCVPYTATILICCAFPFES
jgi:hypothetical protein